MPAGKVTTYTNTLTQKRGVTDLISTIDPMDVPLLNALGYSPANIKKFRLVNFPSTMYEWLEDAYSARNASAAASVTQLTNDTTYTALVVTSGEGVKFQVGDVMALDSELVWVSSISTDTLTITRGFGGTTQATHASTVTVTLRTRARVEGADANDSPTTNPTSSYNYTQILQKTINVTRTRQKVSQYGIENEYDYQTQKAMEELAVLCNNIAYYGKRAAGSASAARGAGGLTQFITTNVNALSSTPALTQKHIEDGVEDCWDFGGKPDLLVCGAWGNKKIRDMYAPHVRTERDDTRGGILIDKILVPPVGWVDLLTDRNCQTNYLYILEADKVGWIPFDEFTQSELSQTGDAAKGEVVGEYGFVTMNEKAHAIISGFSTSK